MTTLTISSAFDFSSSQDWNWTATGATATAITITNGSGYRQTFSGAFSYDSNGNVSGTTNGTNFYLNDALVYSATNMEASAAQLSTFANTYGDTQDTYAYVLRGNDAITGSSGNDVINGYAGVDTITGGAGNDIIDGGVGTDNAVYSGARASYTITQSGNNFIVKALTGTDGTDTLTNIERLKFSDSIVALDISGVAGQAYRLYQAALNRAPDVAGLSNWIRNMDAGMSLDTAANGFAQSAEFKVKFGDNQTNQQFITTMYDNVLHRTPDDGGLLNWMNQLNAGAMTKAQILSGFSESTENQINVIGVIQSGVLMELG